LDAILAAVRPAGAPDRAIAPLLTEFRLDLEARPCSASHVYEVCRLARHVISRAQAVCLGDWTRDAIAGALRTFPVGSRTKVYARAAAFELSEWLVTRDLIAANPVRKIPRPDLVGVEDRRHYTPDEFRRFVGAARARRPERATIY